MKGYCNYIFDFDYTLFDTSKGMDICYKKAINSIGYEYRQKELDCYVKESLEATFNRYSEDEGLFSLFEKTFLETSKENMCALSVPYDDTITTLKILKSINKSLYIVTGKPKERVLEILQKYNCINFFSGIIGYGEYKTSKPSPESLNKCISLYNLSPAHSVYVGDSSYDILAARNAGIDGVLISRDSMEEGISTLFELIRQIKVEFFTVITTEFDLFKLSNWETILDNWCSTNKYSLKAQNKSSVLITIDDNTELSITKNGILILSEYMTPTVENVPPKILEWKEKINTVYKTNQKSRPWNILNNYDLFICRQGKSHKCPFPSKVHYTLIAYNYIPTVVEVLNENFAKQEILWLLTKNRVEELSSQQSIFEELQNKGVCVEHYTNNCFFSGLWGARTIVSQEERALFFKDYVEIERNIQTLWIMLSLTNDYIDKKISLEKGNRALSKLVNFVYDIMFFEAEFKYINAKTSHRYQLNTIKLLLKLSNLNEISQYFKSKSELLEKKLITSNNQKQQENGSILNFTLLILTIVSSIAAIFDVINLWNNNGNSINRHSLIVSIAIALSIIIICVFMKLYLRHRRR